VSRRLISVIMKLIDKKTERSDKKMKKRTSWLGVSLLLVAALVLTGCPVPQAQVEPEPIRLVFAGRDGVFQRAMEFAIQFFEGENPGMEVEYVGLPWRGLFEKITLELVEGRGDFDLIVLDDPWTAKFMPAGFLENLDALFEKKGLTVDPDFINRTVALGRWPYPDGTLYALPVVGNVQLFAYRADLFEKHGIPHPPATWRDALEAARIIHAEEPDVFGVVFRGAKGHSIVVSFLPILWAHGGRVITEDGRSAVDSPEFLKAFELFLSFKEYAPADVSIFGAADVRETLMGGHAAMALEVWPGWVPDLDDPAKSRVAGKVEVVTHPGEKVESAPMLGIWLLGIPRSSRNKEAAFEFLRFVTSPRIQQLKTMHVGNPPTLESLYRHPDILGRFRWYPEQLKALESGIPRPRIGVWSEVEDILGGFMHEALVGIRTPEDAMKAAHAAIEEVLKGYAGGR